MNNNLPNSNGNPDPNPNQAELELRVAREQQRLVDLSFTRRTAEDRAESMWRIANQIPLVSSPPHEPPTRAPHMCPCFSLDPLVPPSAPCIPCLSTPCCRFHCGSLPVLSVAPCLRAAFPPAPVLPSPDPPEPPVPQSASMDSLRPGMLPQSRPVSAMDSYSSSRALSDRSVGATVLPNELRSDVMGFIVNRKGCPC